MREQPLVVLALQILHLLGELLIDLINDPIDVAVLGYLVLDHLYHFVVLIEESSIFLYFFAILIYPSKLAIGGTVVINERVVLLVVNAKADLGVAKFAQLHGLL